MSRTKKRLSLDLVLAPNRQRHGDRNREDLSSVADSSFGGASSKDGDESTVYSKALPKWYEDYDTDDERVLEWRKLRKELGMDFDKAFWEEEKKRQRQKKRVAAMSDQERWEYQGEIIRSEFARIRARHEELLKAKESSPSPSPSSSIKGGGRRQDGDSVAKRRLSLDSMLGPARWDNDDDDDRRGHDEASIADSASVADSSVADSVSVADSSIADASSSIGAGSRDDEGSTVFSKCKPFWYEAEKYKTDDPQVLEWRKLRKQLGMDRDTSFWAEEKKRQRDKRNVAAMSNQERWEFQGSIIQQEYAKIKARHEEQKLKEEQKKKVIAASGERGEREESRKQHQREENDAKAKEEREAGGQMKDRKAPEMEQKRQEEQEKVDTKQEESVLTDSQRIIERWGKKKANKKKLAAAENPAEESAEPIIVEAAAAAAEEPVKERRRVRFAAEPTYAPPAYYSDVEENDNDEDEHSVEYYYRDDDEDDEDDDDDEIECRLAHAKVEANKASGTTASDCDHPVATDPAVAAADNDEEEDGNTTDEDDSTTDEDAHASSTDQDALASSTGDDADASSTDEDEDTDASSTSVDEDSDASSTDEDADASSADEDASSADEDADASSTDEDSDASSTGEVSVSASASSSASSSAEDEDETDEEEDETDGDEDSCSSRSTTSENVSTDDGLDVVGGGRPADLLPSTRTSPAHNCQDDTSESEDEEVVDGEDERPVLATASAAVSPGSFPFAFPASPPPRPCSSREILLGNDCCNDATRATVTKAEATGGDAVDKQLENLAPPQLETDCCVPQPVLVSSEESSNSSPEKGASEGSFSQRAKKGERCRSSSDESSDLPASSPSEKVTSAHVRCDPKTGTNSGHVLHREQRLQESDGTSKSEDEVIQSKGTPSHGETCPPSPSGASSSATKHTSHTRHHPRSPESGARTHRKHHRHGTCGDGKEPRGSETTRGHHTRQTTSARDARGAKHHRRHSLEEGRKQEGQDRPETSRRERDEVARATGPVAGGYGDNQGGASKADPAARTIQHEKHRSSRKHEGRPVGVSSPRSPRGNARTKAMVPHTHNSLPQAKPHGVRQGDEGPESASNTRRQHSAQSPRPAAAPARKQTDVLGAESVNQQEVRRSSTGSPGSSRKVKERLLNVSSPRSRSSHKARISSPRSALSPRSVLQKENRPSPRNEEKGHRRPEGIRQLEGAPLTGTTRREESESRNHQTDSVRAASVQNEHPPRDRRSSRKEERPVSVSSPRVSSRPKAMASPSGSRKRLEVTAAGTASPRSPHGRVRPKAMVSPSRKAKNSSVGENGDPARGHGHVRGEVVDPFDTFEPLGLNDDNKVSNASPETIKSKRISTKQHRRGSDADHSASSTRRMEDSLVESQLGQAHPVSPSRASMRGSDHRPRQTHQRQQRRVSGGESPRSPEKRIHHALQQSSSHSRRNSAGMNKSAVAEMGDRSPRRTSSPSRNNNKPALVQKRRNSNCGGTHPLIIKSEKTTAKRRNSTSSINSADSSEHLHGKDGVLSSLRQKQRERFHVRRPAGAVDH